MTRGIADLTWRRPWLVLGLIGIFVVVAGAFGHDVEEHLKAAGFTDPASESEQATELLRDELGHDANPGLIVLVRDPQGKRLDLSSPKLRSEVARLTQQLRDTQFVGKATDPLKPLESAERKIATEQHRRIQAARREYASQVRAFSAQDAAFGLPAPSVAPFKPPTKRHLHRQRDRELERIAKDLPKRSPLIADDGRSVVLPGYLASQDVEDDGGTAAEDATTRLHSNQLEVGIGGFAPSFNEVNDQTRKDLTKAEIIAFPILAIMLLFVFRGVIAALVPLLIGIASILGTLFALRVMSSLTDTSLFALNIATALSLGLAVDYALLMVSRYREELERTGDAATAHLTTVTTAGKTVLFSGMTVAVAMAALAVFPQRFLYSVAVAGATVAVLASVVTVLAVPAMLSLLGPRINALSIRRGHAVSDESDRWYRLAWAVMRRPAAVALATSALLLACSAPLIGTLLTGPSAEAVPPSQPSYEINNYVDRHYGRGVSEGITVAVRGDVSNAKLEKLRNDIRHTDGIVGGTPFTRASRDVAYTTFAPGDKALSEPIQDAVNEIRDLERPPGTELLVSGNTARFIDQKNSLASHTPLVIAIVAATTLFLLFMLTGSIVLPLKTLLMNTLTLSASLGLVVVAFQDGALSGLLDYTGPEAIEVTSLVFVFAVTFGLATDYAVLVIARIKEQHDLGATNEEAVATGIGRTGRVITAAALMISVVFLAFSVSSIFFMKQIAVAQAAGVIIDATIVRALLVPSLMRLLGDVNWWAPRPLQRFQARFGFREG